jgi:hypothetical protein
MGFICLIFGGCFQLDHCLNYDLWDFDDLWDLFA